MGRFVGFVLDQIRCIGLHARQAWQGNEVTLCNGKIASLKQELFRTEERIEFEDRLANFKKKKESGLSFLQYTLSVLQSLPLHNSDSDQVQFLVMNILILPDKSLRQAIHERLLTLKRQLEEGVIEHRVGVSDNQDDYRGTAPETRFNL